MNTSEWSAWEENFVLLLDVHVKDARDHTTTPAFPNAPLWWPSGKGKGLSMQPIWYGLNLGYLQLLADNRASYFSYPQSCNRWTNSAWHLSLGKAGQRVRERSRQWEKEKQGQRTKYLLFLGFPASWGRKEIEWQSIVLYNRDSKSAAQVPQCCLVWGFQALDYGGQLPRLLWGNTTQRLCKKLFWVLDIL